MSIKLKESSKIANDTFSDQPAPSKKPLLRNFSTILAAGFIIILASVALLAPSIAPFDPNLQELTNRLQGPGKEYLLGTDNLGRDALSRLIFGARISLIAALEAAALALVLGLPLGVIAGYWERLGGTLLTKIMDAIMSVPSLVLAITIVAILGSGIHTAMLAIGIVMAPRFFRVARAGTIDVKHETYIEASEAIGCSSSRTIMFHILPNVLPPIVLVLAVSLGTAVTAEASLSFLGLGVAPPTASWGSMLSTASSNMAAAPHLVWPPGIMIFLTVLSFTYLGDAMRRKLARVYSKGGEN